MRAIGVAFTDTPEGHEAVRVASDIAKRADLPLNVYSVVALHQNWLRPEAVQPDASVVPEEVIKAYREALDRAVAGLPSGVRGTGELLFGEVVDELSMVSERGADLLVCGSRGYGPVRRVLLGTVSSALLRQASSRSWWCHAPAPAKADASQHLPSGVVQWLDGRRC